MVQCRADAAELCNEVQPGGGRVAACLYSRLDDLSPRCHRAMRDGIAMRACGGDYHRYCRDVPVGEGRVAACLRDYRDEISPRCMDALAFNAPRRSGNYHARKYAEPYGRNYDRAPEADDDEDDVDLK